MLAKRNFSHGTKRRADDDPLYTRVCYLCCRSDSLLFVYRLAVRPTETTIMDRAGGPVISTLAPPPAYTAGAGIHELSREFDPMIHPKTPTDLLAARHLFMWKKLPKKYEGGKNEHRGGVQPSTRLSPPTYCCVGRAWQCFHPDRELRQSFACPLVGLCFQQRERLNPS